MLKLSKHFKARKGTLKKKKKSFTCVGSPTSFLSGFETYWKLIPDTHDAGVPKIENCCF